MEKDGTAQNFLFGSPIQIKIAQKWYLTAEVLFLKKKAV